MQDLPDAAPVLLLLPGLTGKHGPALQMRADLASSYGPSASALYVLRQAVQMILTCSTLLRTPGTRASGSCPAVCLCQIFPTASHPVR